MTKDFFRIYDINKNGLFTTDKKQCICGEIVDKSINICPSCKQELKQTKLLNVSKNNTLKKRISFGIEKDIFYYKIFALFSKGFELYEVNVLSFEIDLKTCNVSISDTKYFKSNGNSEEFVNALNKHFPDFYYFVLKSLKEQEYEYATTNFSSLKPDQITNFFYIYWNYTALIPYLRGYKILNYGRSFCLKEKFPNFDFNNEDVIKDFPIYLPIFLTYDLKNIKYIDTIITIYTTQSKENLTIFNNCIDKVLNENNRNLSYNEIMDTFSILYNEDILFDDFIRIFLNSRGNYFCKLLEVQKALKKMNKNFVWTDIEKIDRKFYGTLMSKLELKNKKFSKSEIEDVFSILETNPLNVFDSLIS